ncbi:MAG: VWA domain-containing protein [Actinobacteria bacterium]|nr:MAG: VWA domain-containing protein [Actinomycetota bacterium]
MTFGYPIALVALVAVPALVGIYVLHERRRRAAGARFTRLALLPNMVERVPGWRRHLSIAVLLVALAAMIVGVARDVSRSMSATDVKPTRIQAARTTANTFLAEVPKAFRIGVIAIGSNATVALPPTTDRTLVAAAFRSMRRSEGTALGDAVALAVQVGQKQRTSSGEPIPTAVLVISDGANQGSRVSPQTAATRARALHIPIYTVLVGTPNGIVQRTLTGGYREQIRVPASPTTLQEIARASARGSATSGRRARSRISSPAARRS